MSQASRIALATTSTFTCGMIAWVHFRQKAERYVCSALSFLLIFIYIYLLDPFPLTRNIKNMHQGVVLDMERQRVKKERELDFEMQRQLEEEYKREQNVHSSLEPLNKSSDPAK
jgi:protein PET117